MYNNFRCCIKFYYVLSRDMLRHVFEKDHWLTMIVLNSWKISYLMPLT